jgi:hypothetical protein
MKKNYLEKFNKFNKKLISLNKTVKHLESRNKPGKNTAKEDAEPASANPTDDSSTEKLEMFKKKIKENLDYMRHISDTFPRPNGLK